MLVFAMFLLKIASSAFSPVMGVDVEEQIASEEQRRERANANVTSKAVARCANGTSFAFETGTFALFSHVLSVCAAASTRKSQM